MSKRYTLHECDNRLLNPDWLRERLRYALFRDAGDGFRIESVNVTNVWMDRKRTTILYRTVIADTAGRKRQQVYVGSLVSPQRFAKEYDEYRQHANGALEWGPPVTAMQEHNLVLAAFPLDRKMKLLDEQALHTWLAENKLSFLKMLDAGCSETTHVLEGCQVEPLKYVPAKRYTAACRVRLVSGSGRSREVRFIAKQLNAGEKILRLHRTFVELHQALGELGPARNGEGVPFRIPRCLGVWPERAVIFIEWLEGRNLKRLLPTLEVTTVMQSLGRSLARFQSLPVIAPKQVTWQNELEEVEEAAQVLLSANAVDVSTMDKYLRRFSASCPGHDTPQALLHGSFRLNHVFISQNRFALLDLDSLRNGPASYDIANFLASLYYLEAQRRFGREFRLTLCRHFLQGYGQETAWRIPAAEVLWFLSSLLVNKQAVKYVNHSHQGRAEKARRMLHFAQLCLEQVERLGPDVSLDQICQLIP